MGIFEKAADGNGFDPLSFQQLRLKETSGQNILQQCPPGIIWGDPSRLARPGGRRDVCGLLGCERFETNMNYLPAKHSNFTGDVLLQATAASYNLGPHDFSGDPAKIDKGSLGAKLLQLMERFR